MTCQATACADHAQALVDLEAGRPLATLKIWRQLLLIDEAAVRSHLKTAEATLSADAIAPIRRQAISLAHSLLSHAPGEAEVNQLGMLLRGWGSLALQEVPSRAVQLLERAWSCGHDPQLDHQLASLHARLGYVTGAHWLAPPPEELEFWPQVPCSCEICQTKPRPADPELHIHAISGGRILAQRRRNPWHHSHGVGVWDQKGTLQTSLSRHYPWPWPNCPYQQVFEQTSRHLLDAAAKQSPPPLQVEGPVLAVAELSGEMYFHWQLELLPRLGRIWKAAIERWPKLRLWHNGGESPYVKESLTRLGIPSERLLPSDDHLQANTLLVPSFAAYFGRPSTANMKWLEQFWAVAEQPEQSSLWLGRAGAVRRAVLEETQHRQKNGVDLMKQGSVLNQLHQVARSNRVIAPHGAAMANLIAASPGTEILELVNPAYQPTYFNDLIKHRRLLHHRLEAAPTPLPLQELLYEGPLSFPIDLRRGASPAAEALASWTA
ncbi:MULTISPECIES: glycosyltransferase family 61 protein [unclassified Synechococcus]|uniref:glycosyltransferase family 61 protein n=1 Tax=unclassified Synechococcus TaxID=2626047 RepID=UPI0039AFE2A3